MGGWLAHCFEQQRQDRLIRPQSAYVGERGRQVVALAKRENGTH